MVVLEIFTSPNRLVYVRCDERLGCEKPKFGNPAKSAVSFIRVAKPSYTTRTLSEIKDMMFGLCKYDY
ncbi:MAG: hypothetical protein FWD47_13040 [Treponema sp.]|nr:hypothetical protein [Treponema sp.]